MRRTLLLEGRGRSRAAGPRGTTRAFLAGDLGVRGLILLLAATGVGGMIVVRWGRASADRSTLTTWWMGGDAPMPDTPRGGRRCRGSWGGGGAALPGAP